MGMSRPAVESTLFRARRRLTEEYDDIVSGARCLRITQIIGIAVESRLGARDTRRLARHLSHCQSCRREALAAGLDRELFTRPSVRERVASRVAGLLPFPALLKFRRGGGADARGRRAAARPLERAPADALRPALERLGQGRGGRGGPRRRRRRRGGRAPRQRARVTARAGPDGARPAGQGVVGAQGDPDRGAQAAAPARATPATPAAASKSSDAQARRAKGASRLQAKSKLGGSSSPAAADRATSAGGGSVQTSPGSNPRAGAARRATTARRRRRRPRRRARRRRRPAARSRRRPRQPVTTGQPDHGASTRPSNKTTDTVGGAVGGVGQAVDDTVAGVTGGGPVADTVDQVTDTVDDTVGTVTETVDDTVGGLTGALGGGHGG